jgi:energy-coupling factor transport system ATP-binding protein
MPVRFDDVFYTYQPKSPFKSEALRGVSLEIKDGSFTCIVGHTGSGKSTLIQQMNGLLIPSSGTVFVNDFTVQKSRKSLKNLHNLRKEVGIVFQFARYQLFEETIEADVAFGPMNFGVKKEEALQIAHECLQTVGIDESLYKRSPFEISGGQRRRVAIAGILALRPKILVLDEPTAGLDPRGAQEILKFFKELNDKGTTIVLVTHDINIVFEYATDVIVMNEGKLELQCSPDALFKEDVEKYSLETPLIQKTVNLCLEKGLKIDPSKIHNITELAQEIARAKK